MKYLVIMLLFSNILFGSIGDFFGINAKSNGLSNTQTSAVNDYSAAFFNPAKLPFIGISNGMGFNYNIFKLHINLNDNRTEQNKQDFIIDSPKKEQSNIYGYYFGFTIPIFNTENYGLSVGMLYYNPENDVAKINIFDEKYYQYYKFHSDIQTISMNAGLGFKIFKNFGFGIGVSQLVSVEGSTQVMFNYDDVNGSEITGKDLFLGVVNERSYNLSFYGEIKDFSFGIIYKQALKLPYKIPAQIILKNFNGDGKDATLNILIAGMGVWIAPKLNLGLSYNLKKISTIISSDINYEFWSEAPNPYSYTVLNSDAVLLKIDNLESYKGSVVFSNTINFSLGIEKKFENFDIFGGFQYKPSVIKSHGKSVNYVDNDLYGISVGFSYKISKLLNNTRDLYINLSYAFIIAENSKEYSKYYNSNVDYNGIIQTVFFDLSIK